MSFEKPLLKSYLNVYQYLQDYYLFRKDQSDFSYEIWANELALVDRAYLRLVVAGKRPLNEELLLAFKESLQLADEEKDFFVTLTHYTQSKTQEERRVFGLQLTKYFYKQDTVEIRNHFEFLSNPLFPKLQTLLSFVDIPKTPEKLSLILDIEVEAVAEGLKLLKSLGLAQEESGAWKSIEKSWQVPAQYNAAGLREFYRASLYEAEQAMDLPVADRRFRSLFVAMNSEEYQDFLKDFEFFVNEQLKKRDSDQYRDRRLYQLNFNFTAKTKAL